MEPPGSPASARRISASAKLSVLLPEPRWRRATSGDVERLVRRAAGLAGGVETVVLADDRTVRRLNARHRGRNRPTNVLTFETGPGTGEVVLALGVVGREAEAGGRTVAHHLAHLVVHAALHLRGHDHHGAGEARRMEREESRLLARIGVPNPWKPRAAARPARPAR